MFHLKGALGRPVGRFCEAGRSFITLLGVVSGGVWFYDGDVVFGICGSVGRRVGCWARIMVTLGCWVKAGVRLYGGWCMVVYGCTRYVARRGVVGAGGVGWCTVCVVPEGVPGWGLSILDTECLFYFE